MTSNEFSHQYGKKALIILLTERRIAHWTLAFCYFHGPLNCRILKHLLIFKAKKAKRALKTYFSIERKRSITAFTTPSSTASYPFLLQPRRHFLYILGFHRVHCSQAFKKKVAWHSSDCIVTKSLTKPKNTFMYVAFKNYFKDLPKSAESLYGLSMDYVWDSFCPSPNELPKK